MTLNAKAKILTGSTRLLIPLVEAFDDLIKIWFFFQACTRAGEIKDADIGAMFIEIRHDNRTPLVVREPGIIDHGEIEETNPELNDIRDIQRVGLMQRIAERPHLKPDLNIPRFLVGLKHNNPEEALDVIDSHAVFIEYESARTVFEAVKINLPIEPGSCLFQTKHLLACNVACHLFQPGKLHRLLASIFNGQNRFFEMEKERLQIE
jgi:hypothetical protein